MLDDMLAAPADRSFFVVAVGASAGGLEALTRMFGNVPAGVPAAFVVIQHLDPDHDSVMADLLNRKTDLDVRQASQSEHISPGTIYLIPPGTGLRIHENKLSLVPFLEPRGARRPIDDFFLSLAEEGNHRCAGVILSGTGCDGTMGIQAIKEMGGITIAQSPEDAKYDGMPQSAIQTGAVDRVFDAQDIVPNLLQLFTPQAQLTSHGSADTRALLSDICHQIRAETGHNFIGYKTPTLIRRIERRMQFLDIQSASQYLRYLEENSEECHSLFRDILINVTRFFRDVGNFEILARRAIDPLIASAATGEAVRIWVPGCSTGEEAYTIAMICMYAAERYNVVPQLQIFATDIDDTALAQARLGRYPLSVLQDIPEPYRTRYVDISSKDIQISPRVRDTIRFSPHNLIRDPAFSRMDLISCRNLFIYFNDKTQRRVIPLLHFSLKASGYLFLGPSESVGEHDKLFASIDRHARLFRKRDVPSNYPVEFISNGLPSRPARDLRAAETSNPPPAMFDVSTRRILETYAPATVTINDRGEIVGSSGKLARYFEFSGHQGRELVISVARRGLREVLAQLLRTAQAERTRVMQRDVTVWSEFGSQEVNVIADPLLDGCTLIVFEQKSDFDVNAVPMEEQTLDADGRLHLVEEELQQVRLRLRATIEELETANEELKSSNEEMMSMNEELQSTNEELSTANDELKIKIDQLDVLNSDLRNFFESADLGVVILDAELRVRAFTPRIWAIFPLREIDKGRKLDEIANQINNLTYLKDCERVLAGTPLVERLVTIESSQITYMMRILPYLGFSGQIDGVTITFLDVSELKQVEVSLRQEQMRLRLALSVGRAGIFELDQLNNCIRADLETRRLIGLPEGEYPDDMVPHDLFVDCVHESQREDIRKLFSAEVGESKQPMDIVVRVLSEGAERWVRIISQLGAHRVVLCQDFTDQYAIAYQQQIMLREMNHRIKNLFAVISSIIRLSAREYQEVGAFSEATLERIAALARANMTSQVAGKEGKVDLERLVTNLLEPYPSQHLILSGSDVEIWPAAASALSLVVHEWATNACKYGALATEDGQLQVGWRMEEAGLRFKWTETVGAEGPRAAETAQGPHGFGAKLVTIAISQLSAELSSELRPEGFAASLLIPKRVLAS